jgi:DNA-binding GntR family transcriptional regulator
MRINTAISPSTNNKTTVHAIVQNVKAEIASGTLTSGQRLVEVSLAERFAVKRNKIREALRQLEHDRFVEIIPNVGAIVPELSQKDIENTYDLVGVLEGLAARVATPYVKPGHIKKLERLIAKMEGTDKPSQFLSYNQRFHALLTSLAENNRLTDFTEILVLQLKRLGLQGFYRAGRMTASIKEHKKIVEAIKENNPLKVEKLIRDHFFHAKNELVRYLNKSL